jgi:hypothetical protein
VTDWTWTACTPAYKAQYTERQHAAMLAARRSAASVAAGCSVHAEHWAGCKQLYGAVGTCTVLSMLLPTGLICDLCTGTGSQAQSTGRQAARQSAKVLAMSAVPVVLHSAWSLL